MTKYEYNYKRRNDLGIVLMIFILTLVSVGIGKKNDKLEVKAIAENPPVKIVEKVVYEVPDTPEEYIKYKFGEDADKAFLLLKGDGSPNACAENRNLDTNAINYNWTKVEGVWSSRDRGIFQINDKFHPSVTDSCAFDFKCNIDYAYRMFVNDNHTFVRWTCGRWYGI